VNNNLNRRTMNNNSINPTVDSSPKNIHPNQLDYVGSFNRHSIGRETTQENDESSNDVDP
jgi:hypothetical protein